MNISEKKEIIIISIFFLVISLLFLIISIINENYEYIYYNVALLVGFFVLFLFYKKVHLKIPMLVALITLSFLHLAGGNIIVNGFKLYQTSLFVIPYDKIVHIFGSFVITLIAYNFVEETLSKEDKRKTLLVGFIILMIGIGIGAIVEIIEFLATIIFGNTIVGDYANNAGDLIANLFGALLALIFSLTHFVRNK